MKASEIEVGKVYFSSTNPNWQCSGWGVSKIRIKDATHANWYYDRISKSYAKTTGKSYRTKKGVLVERLNEATGQVMETCVVTLASIKGLWDVVKPVVDSNHAARKKADQEYRAVQDAQYKAAEDAYQRAKAIGLLGISTRQSEMTVPPAVLEMLMDLWAATREA